MCPELATIEFASQEQIACVLGRSRPDVRYCLPLPMVLFHDYDMLNLTQVTFPAQMPSNTPHHRSGAALYYVISGTGLTRSTARRRQGDRDPSSMNRMVSCTNRESRRRTADLLNLQHQSGRCCTGASGHAGEDSMTMGTGSWRHLRSARHWLSPPRHQAQQPAALRRRSAFGSGRRARTG